MRELGRAAKTPRQLADQFAEILGGRGERVPLLRQKTSDRILRKNGAQPRRPVNVDQILMCPDTAFENLDPQPLVAELRVPAAHPSG